MTYQYAQTNLQLFNQLQQKGYSTTELKCIAKSYQLAMQLFTGVFRSSGKTFIAHLVGTASILASLHTSIEIIAAGLLHAAYSYGDFGGNGKKGISNAKRQWLKHQIGEKIEIYVAKYTALKWKVETIPEIYQRFDTMDAIERDVLLIRLANELEEYQDFGLLYGGEIKQHRYDHHQHQLVITLTKKLNYPTLADELDNSFKKVAQVTIPSELCRLTSQKSSDLLVPNSCQRKFLVWFYQAILLRVNRRLSFIKQRFKPTSI